MSLISVLLGATLAGRALSTPLDDYVSKPDPNYGWKDTGARVKLLFGGTAHILNVTSQQWLDESKAVGPNGALWTHQVAVVIPKKVRYTNVSVSVLTGGCNENPKPPTATDEYLAVVDRLTDNTGTIGIVVYQIPNCHIVYPSDPEQKGREEDAMIAWAWNEYLKNTSQPEWLPRLPMVKGAMACMKATEEYIKSIGTGTIESWIVSGASKRGWTSWLVGAVDCPTCPKIQALAPLVPIVPDLLEDVHRQWKSYGGFTFAFKDYTDVNLTTQLDGDAFGQAMQIVDPINYGDRLDKLPKFVVLSSDDEFMQFDWTNLWYDKLGGEKHLLIVPDSEHSLSSAIPELLTSLTAAIASVVTGKTERPNFTYAVDKSNGEISVTIPEGVKHGKVVLRYAMTLTKERRDFRWVRLASPETGNCTLPDIPLKKDVFGANCVQPIIWLGKTLEEDPNQAGVFKALPPKPLDGFWMGYYIEVFYPADTEGVTDDFQFTTPGFVWPDTLPFKDCSGDTCIGRLV